MHTKGRSQECSACVTKVVTCWMIILIIVLRCDRRIRRQEFFCGYTFEHFNGHINQRQSEVLLTRDHPESSRQRALARPSLFLRPRPASRDRTSPSLRNPYIIAQP